MPIHFGVGDGIAGESIHGVGTDGDGIALDGTTGDGITIGLGTIILIETDIMVDDWLRTILPIDVLMPLQQEIIFSTRAEEIQTPLEGTLQL